MSWLVAFAMQTVFWTAFSVHCHRRAFRLGKTIGKTVGYSDGYCDGIAWASESWSHFVRVHLGIKAPDRESAN
jgi:hypothetical protein